MNAILTNVNRSRTHPAWIKEVNIMAKNYSQNAQDTASKNRSENSSNTQNTSDKHSVSKNRAEDRSSNCR